MLTKMPDALVVGDRLYSEARLRNDKPVALVVADVHPHSDLRVLSVRFTDGSQVLMRRDLPVVMW